MDLKDKVKDVKSAILKLREKVKMLSAKQRPLKKARKTSIPEEDRRSILLDAGVEWKPSSPWESHMMATIEVGRRKALITAVINLSHELRGSEHRHGHGDEYLYEKCQSELRAELLGLS